MKKEELIDLLKKGVYWEDEFIMNYDTNSFWDLIEASVSKEKFEKIKDLFSRNIEETHKHKEILNNLIEKISQEGKDEY